MKSRWKIVNNGLTTDGSITKGKLKHLCNDQNAVLHSVIRSFPRTISQTLPLGFRSICIFQRSEDEEPITIVSNIDYYCIGLSTSDRYYSQIAYQFAHEFCHIYADPRITNWFIESVCEMTAQYTLRQLSGTWAKSSLPMSLYSFSRKSYAPRFKEYLDNCIKNAHLETVGIDAPIVDRQLLLDWLKRNMSDLENPYNRKRNKIIAEFIRPTFEANSENWRIISLLGKASSPSPKTPTDYIGNTEFSFDRLQGIVPGKLKDVIQELRSILLS